jgi:hypothetical protein
MQEEPSSPSTELSETLTLTLSVRLYQKSLLTSKLLNHTAHLHHQSETNQPRLGLMQTS